MNMFLYFWLRLGIWVEKKNVLLANQKEESVTNQKEGVSFVLDKFIQFCDFSIRRENYYDFKTLRTNVQFSEQNIPYPSERILQYLDFLRWRAFFQKQTIERTIKPNLHSDLPDSVLFIEKFYTPRSQFFTACREISNLEKAISYRNISVEKYSYYYDSAFIHQMKIRNAKFVLKENLENKPDFIMKLQENDALTITEVLYDHVPVLWELKVEYVLKIVEFTLINGAVPY